MKYGNPLLTLEIIFTMQELVKDVTFTKYLEREYRDCIKSRSDKEDS